MKEAGYNSLIVSMLVHNYGGRAIKIFNPAVLGLPDTAYYRKGIISFLEIKIGDRSQIIYKNGVKFCRPWNAINDLRQFEVCRAMSKEATVLYVIYWPHIKMTAVIPMELFIKFKNSKLLMKEGWHFVKGHGLNVIITILEQKRRMMYEDLYNEFEEEEEKEEEEEQ